MPGNAWIHTARDIVAAAHLMVRGHIGFIDYVRSLRQKLTFATLCLGRSAAGHRRTAADRLARRQRAAIVADGGVDWRRASTDPSPRSASRPIDSMLGYRFRRRRASAPSSLRLEARALGRRIVRRAGKTLRDRHPALRGLAFHHQLRVGDVAGLRHHLTELHRIAFDRRAACRIVPLPDFAGRPGDAHIGNVRRHRQLAVGEGPAERLHADHRDVLQPIVKDAILAHHVVDFLAVRPGLHLPRGGEHPHAHAGTGPRQPRRRILRRKQFAQRLRADPTSASAAPCPSGRESARAIPRSSTCRPCGVRRSRRAASRIRPHRAPRPQPRCRCNAGAAPRR